MTQSEKNSLNTLDFFEELKELNSCGTDIDEMPEDYGEFGLEVTNPIPVCTVFGNIAYLSKLRTLLCEKISYERRGSAGPPNIKAMIDFYIISCHGKEIATLYLYPYNKRNSNRPPKGFNIFS